MKSIGLWIAVGAVTVTSQAQLPPPASGARPTNLPTLGTNASLFSRSTNFGRFLRTNTAAPGVPTAVAGPRTAPRGPNPAAPATTAGAVQPATGPGAAAGPGRTGVPAIGSVAGPGVSTNFVPTNVVARGSDTIPANMMRFQEADVSQIFELYSELTGKTILRSPQVPQNVKISMRNQTLLTRQEGIDALNTILGLNQISMIDEGEKFIKAVPQAAVPQEATPFGTNNYELLRPSQVPVAQIVTLKNLSPEEATSILQPFAKLPNSIVGVKGSPVLVLRDYSENVKRMMEMLEKIDVAMPLDIDTVVIPIKYALAGEIASVLSGLSAGGSTTSFGSSGAGGLGSGGGAGGGFAAGSSGVGLNRIGVGGSSAAGGFPGGYGSPSGAAGAYGGGARQFGSTSGAGGAFGAGRTGFGGQLNRAVAGAVNRAGGGGAAAGDIQLIGPAKIIADERSNALLIFADRHDLTMISNIISKLDVVLPQVLIEALIMEVNLGNSKQVGVTMAQPTKKFGDLTTAGISPNGNQFIDPKSLTSFGSNFIGAGGLTYFGKINDDFEIAVHAAENDDRITLLSRPRVQTSTAKPASIFIGETRPYVTGTYYSGIAGGNSSQYSQLQIGINLDVLPIINQEGLVVMDIQQHISQAGANVIIDGNDVPSTINRDANAYVAVRDRDTIVLGGFINTVKKKSTGGVPYLKDIPGLGVLFRSNSEDLQRVELMLMIRPTVLPTPEIAALAAAAEKDRMPNIKKAERDEQDYSRTQREKERKAEEKAEHDGQ